MNGKFSEKFFYFIAKNKNEDIFKLRLKNGNNDNIDTQFAITQIECRKKAAKKIPEILKCDRFLFPAVLLSEQCTHETIARFHSTLFDEGQSVLDMTAGLCVDSYYISKKVKRVTALEIDPHYASINILNMQALGANVKVINCDASEYITKNDAPHYDAIFVDPARRDDNNSKLFGFEDCSPNIISLLESISKKCKYLIIKASPMLDITEIYRQLPNISDIWVIGIKNECKEILIKLCFDKRSHNILIHTINFIIGDNNQEFDFNFNESKSVPFALSTPEVGDYIYEPNCCIMKVGKFDEFNKFPEMSKIHNNTHLFFSKNLYTNFPGRVFKIDKIIPFKDKSISSIRQEYKYMNVSTRNFKLTSDELKKRLKVKDGGDIYLFGTTFKDQTMNLIIAKKAIS